jgi:enoyl-CoA hydratase/carnithine racemase
MRPFDTLLYEQDRAVVWVTLNRPEVHNSINSTMQLELREVWTELRYDDSVRVAIVTGAGDRAFTAGLDLTESWSGAELPWGVVQAEISPFMRDEMVIGPKQCDLWKPVIAAVNGFANAAAFYLLGEVDFIIAAEHATFFDSHVTGAFAATAEPLHLLGKMPFHEVVRMALLGSHERITAQRAHQVGFVSEVVPLEQLRDTASWAARTIASASPIAVQGTLRALWAGLEESRGNTLDLAWAFSNLSQDREAMAAYAAQVGRTRITPRLR